MHPGMYHWWKQRQADRCGGEAYASCGSGGHEWGWRGRHHEHFEASHGDEGGGFGVRRPLRFLAHKLELDERQVGELARILSELKTERAQAEVDQRRTVTAFADAITAESFDEGKAGDAAGQRTRSAERVRDAVLKALREIHSILGPEQRQHFAYLLRTGVVTL